MSQPDQRRSLTAEYRSTTDAKEWSFPQQPLPAQPETKEKVSYLSALRSDITVLQSNVNRFLTERMEEDKRKAQPNGNGAIKVDESKEEENYGEEVDCE